MTNPTQHNPNEDIFRSEVRRKTVNEALIGLGWLLKEDERMCFELQQFINDAVEALIEIDDEMLECDDDE